jgi:RNA polymerase sigma-70 factor (ECF subfamily)
MVTRALEDEAIEASATPISIEHVYTDYYQPILRHLERLVSNHQTAEDLVQETFIKALRHWGQVDHVTSVRGWLYRIATNTAYDYLRRGRRIEIQPLTDDHAQTFTAPPIETQFDDAEPILAALHRIPEHYRRPLLLTTAGYDHKHIAAALNSNVNTIKTRVHRARMQFRQHYAA